MTTNNGDIEISAEALCNKNADGSTIDIRLFFAIFSDKRFYNSRFFYIFANHLTTLSKKYKVT